ncbi:putative MFS glucose transporter [Talaromyces proteolyticus]|uniref:MFS glucose transporter n=1 Tax=Talaromyces proteolyticus TaxID=1131652 RepID=A0AAD4KRM9_9EURO|nr:putative MFS glucose transporter [Talaromyces proteolyticus]KAH8695012.1 putative MFS glucose transporter [Talaromyces proteolyticus]
MVSPTPSRSKVTPYLIYLVFVATLGPLQFGFHLAELNAPQAVVTCEKKSITLANASTQLPQCIQMNASQFGLVSSIYTLGGFLGALVSGPLATRSGRRLILRATTAFFVLGSVAEALSPNIAIIALGRFLSGIGAGASIVVGPIFVSEIAPPQSRGFFGAFTQVMTNVGILLTQTLGYFLSRDSLWRSILGVGAALGAAEFFGLLFVPESPVWLAEHRHGSEALRILQRIRGKDADIEEEARTWKVVLSAEDGTGEEESLLSPPSQHAGPREPSVTILTVAMDAQYRPAIIAVVIVMLAQQFTGVNSIIMYSVSLLQSTLPTAAPLLAVMISAINLVVTLACSPLPDKIGRKTCLLLSVIGMGSGSVLLAIGISVGQKILSALASLFFVASFAVGLGPVPFILASELVGPEAVGATQSWALSANWIATFIVAQFFPVLNEALGGTGKIYWIFAALAALFGFLIQLKVPETNGKTSLDEVWGRAEERRID